MLDDVSDLGGRVHVALRALAALALLFGIAIAAFAWAVGRSAVAPAILMIVAPAVFVWFRPDARTVGLWTGVAYFCSLLLLLCDSHVADPTPVKAWLGVFLPVLLAVLPIATHATAALACDRLTGEPAPLARKLRSLAIVVFGITGVLAVVGWLDAGGLSLIIALALAISPGLAVYASPTRTRGWRWVMYGAGLGLPGAVRIELGFACGSTSWPRHLVELGLGMVLVLLLLGLPVILLFTRGDDDPSPAALPPARML
jgi:hypothetical protein